MTFDEFMQDPVNTLYAFSEEELRNIKRKISEKNLQQLQKLAEDKFLGLSGMAQQYLFYWRRELEKHA